MLNTDWALMFETQVDATTYKMGCSPQALDAGETDDSDLPACTRYEDAYTQIHTYAEDYDAWMVDFAPAYEKMQRNGCTACTPV